MQNLLDTEISSINEEVTSYIEKLAFELKKFSGLLKFEKDALQNRNYDEVNQTTEEKTCLIKKIQKIDDSLKAIFHDSQKETTLQEYIRSMPNGEDLKTKWAEQMILLDRCNKQNSENKKLVDQYINEVHSIIDILNINDNPQVYNKAGVSQYGNSSTASYSNRI